MIEAILLAISSIAFGWFLCHLWKKDKPITLSGWTVNVWKGIMNKETLYVSGYSDKGQEFVLSLTKDGLDFDYAKSK